MTLQDAMRNCESCFSLYREFKDTEAVKDAFQAARELVREDAELEGVNPQEEGSLHYLMMRACNVCGFGKPAIYNLGKAHLE